MDGAGVGLVRVAPVAPSEAEAIEEKEGQERSRDEIFLRRRCFHCGKGDLRSKTAREFTLLHHHYLWMLEMKEKCVAPQYAAMR
jgi:hypothetical protein